MVLANARLCFDCIFFCSSLFRFYLHYRISTAIDQVPDDWKTSDGNDSTRTKGAAANAHQFTSPKEKSNVKLTSPNGETEGIYNKEV